MLFNSCCICLKENRILQLHHLYKATTFFVFSLAVIQLNANSGTIGYVYPINSISIDGDLSDWSNKAKIHQIGHIAYGGTPRRSEDFSGTIRLGYNLQNQSLYIAAEIFDDEFVVNPAEPFWFNHDLQVLYLDPEHSVEGSGVIGYEITLDTQKIVHQDNMPFYPQVKKASWDNVEMKIKHQGNKIVYEWRVFLGSQLRVGKTIGFDYGIMDKDTDEDLFWLSWGAFVGSKHDNYKNIADLVIMPKENVLGKIEGKLEWKEDNHEHYPGLLRLTNQKNPNLWVQAQVDSLGNFQVELPEGNYKLDLGEDKIFEEPNLFKVKMESIAMVSCEKGQTMKIPSIVIDVEEFPTFLPEKGLLHDFNKEKQAQLEQYLQTGRKYYGIPGASLALIKEGKVMYHKTFGYTNAITQERVEENNLFEAASVTKPVFAYVVHRLVEKQIIDLDKPLHEYLPFEELEGNEAYKLMTGRHVLRHLTGLPNWGRRLVNTPGTKFGYSGEGFEYLKRVIMKITGKSMQQILDEELIQPIGLYNTHFSDNQELKKVVVNGHYNSIPSIAELPGAPGMAWSMHTEANAFSKFAIHLLERKGLKKETYAEFMTLYNEYPLDEGEEKPKHTEGMGQGISIRKSPYGQTFGHGGNNGDFQCHFEVYDDLKMGYVIFTNSNNGYHLIKDLAAILVDGNK